MSRSRTGDSETLPVVNNVQDTSKEQGRSSKPASVLVDLKPEAEIMDPMEQHYKQILEAPLDPSHGLHGVLRYRREPLERRVSLQPQISTDQSAWCEFCGTAAKPPLYQVHREGLEDFCCVRYREVFEEVTQETRFVLKLTEERPSETVKSEELKSTVENELELGVGEWDSEEHRAQQKEMERFYKEAQARLSSENSFYNTKTISFQLSSCVPVEGISAVKKESRKEEKPEFCEWKNSFGSGPAGFGLHHHQDACFIQKCYPNGNKFLTAFPDGSAQVFYPSGNLAVILLINEKEKVCVVHDDITHQSPIRALFQSNGRATCYHGNGGVWLNMDMFGGRSLDKGGAKTRRWSWSDHTQTPTPLRPIFLSLNKNVGVRILGRQCVFVSFLALAQQAKFSVGSCMTPKDDDCPHQGSSLSEEELLLISGRLYLRLTLTRLRTCHRFPSSPRHQNTQLSPVLLSVARRLLRESYSLNMKDRDRTFIQHCLQDYQ